MHLLPCVFVKIPFSIQPPSQPLLHVHECSQSGPFNMLVPFTYTIYAWRGSGSAVFAFCNAHPFEEKKRQDWTELN